MHDELTNFLQNAGVISLLGNKHKTDEKATINELITNHMPFIVSDSFEPHVIYQPAEPYIGSSSKKLHPQIFIKMRKNGYTKMCIQFDLEYRFMKFRYPHAVGTLQHILKKMKIQIGDENTLQCSEHRNIFDYKIRITGPQNYDEMYPDKLDETLNCNVLDKSSQGRSITIDVGGKEFVSNTAVFRRLHSKVQEKIRVNPILMKDGEQTTTALHFMIDRDGENFGYILEFLTNGHLVLPSNFPEYKLLLKEAQFYEIQPLVDNLLRFIESNKVL